MRCCTTIYSIVQKNEIEIYNQLFILLNNDIIDISDNFV